MPQRKRSHRREHGPPPIAGEPCPQLVAHRGYALRYPENTLESLAAAVAAGAEFLEFDIQLTADRVPVLLHDPTLERTASRADSVLDLDAADVVAVEVNEAERLGGAFSGVTIPRLREAIAALARWPGVTAFVELKDEGPAAFGVEFAVARVLEDLSPLQERCVVIAYDPRVVAAARRLGAVAVGWVVGQYDDAGRRTADDLAPEYLFCNHQRLPPEPATLWPGPWRWVCYEVTEAALARRLARRGVAMIETMAVAEMLAALRVPGPRGVDGV